MHQMKHATGEGLLFISDRLANAQRLVAPVRPISEAQAKVAGTEIVCDRGKLSCKTALTDRELEIHVQSACNESAEDAGFANHGNPRMSKLRRINAIHSTNPTLTAIFSMTYGVLVFRWFAPWEPACKHFANIARSFIPPGDVLVPLLTVKQHRF